MKSLLLISAFFLTTALQAQDSAVQHITTSKVSLASTQTVKGFSMIKDGDLNKFLANINGRFTAQQKAFRVSLDSANKIATKLRDSIVKASARAVSVMSDTYSKLATPVVGEEPTPLDSGGKVYQLKDKPVGRLAVYVGRRLRSTEYKITSTGKLTLNEPGVPVVDYYK